MIPAPVAFMVNRVLLPGHTLLPVGWAVILAVLFTDNTAAADVTVAGQAVLETVSRYLLLFIDAVIPVRVNVEAVSPGKSINVTPPSVLTCH